MIALLIHHAMPIIAGAGVANALYRPNPSRRRYTSPSPSPASRDAELIALCTEFERLQIQQDDIAERAKTISALTLAGFQAKVAIARDLLWRHHKNGIEGGCAGEEVDFVWAMLNDLLRLNEGAGS